MRAVSKAISGGRASMPEARRSPKLGPATLAAGAGADATPSGWGDADLKPPEADGHAISALSGAALVCVDGEESGEPGRETSLAPTRLNTSTSTSEPMARTVHWRLSRIRCICRSVAYGDWGVGALSKPPELAGSRPHFLQATLQRDTSRAGQPASRPGPAAQRSRGITETGELPASLLTSTAQRITAEMEPPGADAWGSFACIHEPVARRMASADAAAQSQHRAPSAAGP